MGHGQIARILDMDVEDLDVAACGINHFTWFQRIAEKQTGKDLYPRLREAERSIDWLAEWDEWALGRILFRRFGLWPSPATNHYGEYIRWANEFIADDLQYFHDRADGNPWETGDLPEFVYSLSSSPTARPLRPAPEAEPDPREVGLEPSGELAVPIMEGIVGGTPVDLAAVNLPNCGAIPNLPDEMVVETPGIANADGVRSVEMGELPEGIAALLRVQGSIQQLIVEAFAERSKDKLIHAVLLDPTVDSYRGAIEMVEELCRLQADLLPEWR
jgi:alpha-galactosidase